jgi:hypothetical protein
MPLPRLCLSKGAGISRNTFILAWLYVLIIKWVVNWKLASENFAYKVIKLSNFYFTAENFWLR